MKTESQSFKDILREKMEHFPSENEAKNTAKSGISGSEASDISSRENNLDESLWSQKIQFETVIFTAKKYSRSASLIAKKVEKTIKTPSEELALEVNSLSKEAISSLETMKKLGAFELNSSKISLSLVKRAFRRLCLVYHPDQQTTDISPRELEQKSLFFGQLKEAKDGLEEFFSTYNKKNISSEEAA